MPDTPCAPRLSRLPVATVLGLDVRLAWDRRARLLGLSHLDRNQAGPGLLIPRCSSVHTFGMRFRLDLYFLDQRGVVVSRRLAVPPRRFAFCRRASAVLELPAQEGGEIFPASS
jgi:uncharacterized membrane protein (UPF0127 family)